MSLRRVHHLDVTVDLCICYALYVLEGMCLVSMSAILHHELPADQPVGDGLALHVQRVEPLYALYVWNCFNGKHSCVFDGLNDA
jgi:hypothetical protein